MSPKTRWLISALALVGVCAAIVIVTRCGENGVRDDDEEPLTIDDVLALEGNRGASGDGTLRFEVVMTSEALPEEVFETNPYDKQRRSVLESAHAGFALDSREGRGEVYWALQGAGILRIDAAVTKVELLPTDPLMVEHNLHNATFFVHDGQPMISWPANLGHRVFVTDLDGKILHDIGIPTVDPYQGGAVYKPTDTEYLDGKLWVTDGYGSHHVMSYDLVAGAWTGTIFAGSSNRPENERIKNPHGITIYDGVIYVAGRWFARIHQFRPDTTFIDMFPLPKGSKPCDFEFFVLDGQLYGVASSLEPAKDSDSEGASIYIVDMATLKIVSTITPKDDLGLSGFDHHHNTLPRVVDGRVYLYDQAWKNGDFAVYRQTD